MAEGYALGALDAADRAAFESHLTSCHDCARAVEEARVVVSQLAYLAPDAQPSDMLRRRLLQSVRAGAPGAVTIPRKTAVPVWLWAGVAAMLVVTLYSTWEARNLQREIRATNERAALELKHREVLEAQYLAARREAMIVTDPKSVKIMMRPADKGMPEMEAMWHEKLGIVVMAKDVPMPANDRTLQLWLIPKAAGSKPMPAGVVRPDANGQVMMLVATPPEEMPETKALAITEEPAGGSLQPTTAPKCFGTVS